MEETLLKRLLIVPLLAVCSLTLVACGAGKKACAPGSTDPECQVPVIAFQASAYTTDGKTPVLLSWTVTNATDISIDNGIGVVSATGTVEVTPTETTTY